MQIPIGFVLFPVVIVLVPDNTPVDVFLVKIDTVLEPLFAVYTLAPSAEMHMLLGSDPVAIVLVPDNAPVDVFLVKIDTVSSPL
jgi:hypothetical protein